MAWTFCAMAMSQFNARAAVSFHSAANFPVSIGPRVSLPAPYLVVVSDVIVGMDIADAIASVLPEAQVLRCRDASEAQRVIGPHRDISRAFVEAEPVGFAGSPLAHDIAKRGGHVVLLCDFAEGGDPSFGGDILLTPFGAGDIRRYLRKEAENGGT